jgi:hypothetical protein
MPLKIICFSCSFRRCRGPNDRDSRAPGHSCRRHTIGSRFPALLAGQYPKNSPTPSAAFLGPRAGRGGFGRTLFDAARLSNHLSNGLHEVPYGSDDSIDRAWQVSDYPNCPTRNRPASARPKL